MSDLKFSVLFVKKLQNLFCLIKLEISVLRCMYGCVHGKKDAFRKKNKRNGIIVKSVIYISADKNFLESNIFILSNAFKRLL